MSGLVGAFFRDGRPLDSSVLSGMLEAIAYRGPDGCSVWHEGSLGLGHLMLHTTPESLHEKLPKSDESGRFVITADARIDNRDELMSRLGMKSRPGDVIDDSRIILQAYEKWGEGTPEKLLGDFAFCIVDRKQNIVFCARDAAGDRPFYYYLSDKVFAFGSEIRALLVLPDTPRRLNEAMVGDYLIGMFDDQVMTFYKGILRLPPGHSIAIGPDQYRLRCYWSLDPNMELHLGSDEQYADAFREIFTEAVRCRLRSAYPVMSTLSGGLDSSSVTCVARNFLPEKGIEKLRTVSLVYDHVSECDERRYIKAVVDQGRIDPHYFNGEQVGTLPYVECDPWDHDDPFDAPNSYAALLGELVSGLGGRIILDGIDGDTTVSHGYNRLPELLRKGNWPTLLGEVSALSRSRHCGFWGLLWRQAVKPLTPAGIRRGWRLLSGRGERPWDRHTFINRDFARRIGLKERYNALQAHRLGPPENSRLAHWNEVTWGGITHQIESINNVSARFKMEVRHPFRDRRLMEFCLALPPEQKLHKGLNRMVMRRAMAGVLPREIQQRGDKVDFGPSISYWLLRLDQELAEEAILGSSEAIHQYVDVQALTRAYSRFRVRPVGSLHYMMYAASLGQWLKRAGLEP